ncbi:MAG: hypothetical protein K9N05_08155, partial [Candidatus Marinimicrobia bacterium]|nr:hypothetical protein [Candidatus Neomarinimicrobiota bacterium]
TLRNQYNYNVFMFSYETAKTTLTAQVYKEVGFHGGGGMNLFNEGYSIFGELCVPFTPLTIFGRYDLFWGEFDCLASWGLNYEIYIGGIAWKFYKKNRLLFDIEHEACFNSMTLDVTKSTTAELALEIVF